jgi:peptide/nickel transport system permease protein
MAATLVPDAQGGPAVLDETAVPVTHRRLRRGSIAGELARRPAAIFAMLVLAFLLLTLVAAPLLAPHDPLQPNFDNRYGSPSAEHWLGTDALGRDLLSRVIYGGQRALLVAVPATLGGCVAGLALGMVSGYFGGKIDNALIVLMDTIQSMPIIILGIAFISIMGRNMTSTLILFAIGFTPAF